MSVLWIENEPLNYPTITRILKELCIEDIETVPSVSSAIARLTHATKMKPKVVILDAILPLEGFDASGLFDGKEETCRKYSGLAVLKECPSICTYTIVLSVASGGRLQACGFPEDGLVAGYYLKGDLPLAATKRMIKVHLRELVFGKKENS